MLGDRDGHDPCAGERVKRQRRPRGMRLCGLSVKECEAAFYFDDAHIPCMVRADVLRQVGQTRAAALREGERKGLLRVSRWIKGHWRDDYRNCNQIDAWLRAEAERLEAKQ